MRYENLKAYCLRNEVKVGDWLWSVAWKGAYAAAKRVTGFGAPREGTMKLKTCPFCGGQPTMIYRRTFKEFYVCCNKPGCWSRCGFMPPNQYEHWHRTVESADAVTI